MGRTKRTVAPTGEPANGNTDIFDVVNNGDDGSGVESFTESTDTGTGAGTAPEPGTAKRRGRPAGSTGKPKTSRLNDLEFHKGGIMSLHEMLAFITGMDSLTLDDMEAEQLAKALMRLQEFYPSVDVPAQFLAWVGLGGTCAKIYGSRVTAWKLTKKREKEMKGMNKPGPIAVAG